MSVCFDKRMGQTNGADEQGQTNRFGVIRKDDLRMLLEWFGRAEHNDFCDGQRK